MCLAIPGKIEAIYDEHGLRMGSIDYAGTGKPACLEYVPDAEVGQYVIVHAGFAISILDEEEARKTLDLFDELAAAAAEEGTDIFGMPLEKTVDEEGGS